MVFDVALNFISFSYILIWEQLTLFLGDLEFKSVRMRRANLSRFALFKATKKKFIQFLSK